MSAEKQGIFQKLQLILILHASRMGKLFTLLFQIKDKFLFVKLY